MYGQPQFVEINARLNKVFVDHQVLCVAHRGVSSGMIVENTIASTRAAMQSGADMVEIDVSRSTDGVFFAFHDGLEPHHLGEQRNLTSLSSEEVTELRYLIDGKPNSLYPIQQLREILTAFKGRTLFNVDRSWNWWPELLPLFDSLNMADQLLLKAPADHPAIDFLRSYKTKFPFMPICKTIDQAMACDNDPTLNTIGLELLATTSRSTLIEPRTIERLSVNNVFLFANAEVVDPGKSLCAGYDDSLALEGDPDLAWGELVRRGFRAIQTDWPWLLREHLNKSKIGSSSASDQQQEK